MADYTTWVRRATGVEDFDPHVHQVHLATHGLPEVLRADTGTGKTLAVVLGWLFRLVAHPDLSIRQATPPRLVYALPTRGLVEQVSREVYGWVERVNQDLPESDRVLVHRVMGGEEWSDKAWRMSCERPQVFVGTVDMLLSRALNRGYADSRWNWPISFGLFNNGCHWIFDEVQLMGVALPTSRQIQAFRRLLGTAQPSSSTWMSATLDEEDLLTIDAPEITTKIDLADFADLSPGLQKRIDAEKTVEELHLSGQKKYERLLALEAIRLHDQATANHGHPVLTVVIANTVERATAIHGEIERALPESSTPVLLHSRFRPGDRARRVEEVEAAAATGGGGIVVSTQVLEAGIDLDAQVVVTEAAPWSSIVQRAGRCNRSGGSAGAVLAWVEPTGTLSTDKDALPYDKTDVEQAIAVLRDLEAQRVTPRSLSETPVPRTPVVLPVLRRRDLIEFFDTSPDLSGNDVDVSRFIRDSDERTVHIAWRDIEGPDSIGSRPRRDELCPVPISDAREFVKDNRGHVWRLDHLARSRAWVRCDPRDLRPGLLVVADVSAGGYSPETGWSKKSSSVVEPVTVSGEDDDETHFGIYDCLLTDEPATTTGRWYPLEQHLEDVGEEIGRLLATDPLGRDLDLPSGFHDAAVLAGRLHDIGKAHPVFQQALVATEADEAVQAALREEDTWGKSGNRGRLRFDRQHFRHEVASFMALFGEGGAVLRDHPEPDLVRYLVLAHHGRARLGLRRLPEESAVDEQVRVLGVQTGDVIEAETPVGAVTATLDFADVGLGDGAHAPSWSARALKLRDRHDLGPFRLAFLEAIVRLADWRASAREAGER